MVSVPTIILSVLLAVLSGTHIQLNGTDRLPSARGVVTIAQSDGATRVFIRADGMKPASLFGGDFNTYVLWLISPEGRPVNAGEIPLNGEDGRLQASTNLQTFSVLVTAEPHYAVATPSRFVVLSMAETADRPGFECKTKAIAYNYERNSLADATYASGPVHTALQQAYTAVRLAERAGAGRFAAEEMRMARQSLWTTLALSQESKPVEVVEAGARRTIELAVTAQRLAEDRNPDRYK